MVKKYVIRMNMNRKYHTREHYEIILLELLKLAGKKNIDVRSLFTYRVADTDK
jgi:hypothetical protein